MADQPPTPATGVADVRRGSRPPTPRWVKVFGVIAAVVILLFVILLLTGNGHGPGRHTGPGGGESRTPPAGVHAP